MYQTLYRKYRPHTFQNIVGQDSIVKVLKNSIKNEKIGHAYLFIGPRGTGKTSTAKIFARAINCLNSEDGDLCDNCKNCVCSSNSNCMDILEIDAASNNGVDEIRNLKEKVNLVPNELKYKVYIIDEVHMLTIQAFNALLKTLEEPPSHIVFILATTDPQKIPETILSRCQCYNFSRISNENIVDNLKKISELEKIQIDNEVLNQIAIVSDGGMRDSIGLLDKISSYKNGKITIEDFISITGLVTNNDIKEIINNIENNDIENVIKTLEKWNDRGSNLIQILVQMLEFLKNTLLDAYIYNNCENNIEIQQDLANLINEKLVDIKKSSNPKIYIEILLLNFMSNITKKTENISREIFLEQKFDKNKKEENENNIPNKIENKIIEKPVEKKKINNLEEIKEIMKIRMNNTFVDANKEYLKEAKEKIKQLDKWAFDLNIGYLVCTLLDGNVRLASDKYIVLSYSYESVVNDNLENLENLEKIIEEKTNEKISIVIITDDDWNKYAKEYVENKKNNVEYVYLDEPNIKKEINKSEKKANNTSILDEFSDILEIS